VSVGSQATLVQHQEVDEVSRIATGTPTHRIPDEEAVVVVAAGDGSDAKVSSGSGSGSKCVSRAIERTKAVAAAKREKYTSECSVRGIEFEAFVVESHGYCDQSVNRVLESMAQYAERVSRADFKETLGYFKRRIAIVIQRGQHRLDGEAVHRSMNSYGAGVARGLLMPRRSDER
jgi:hypothetical protein